MMGYHEMMLVILLASHTKLDTETTQKNGQNQNKTLELLPICLDTKELQRTCSALTHLLLHYTETDKNRKTLQS